MIEFGRTHWDDNWSAGFSVPMLGGGLQGFTEHVCVTRHCPLMCKPGLWHMGLSAGPEVLGMVSHTGFERFSCDCVIDDFGNLQAVPS